MITGVNHITLSVSDLILSIEFYRLLGAKAHVRWENGASLSLGDLWLCLSLCDIPYSPLSTKGDYTHIALNVDRVELTNFRRNISELNIKTWQENRSEGESLYILDPDGHKLELHVGSLQSRLDSLKAKPYQGLVWYNEL
ncbi:VOC family protein [Pseudoalteromonas umbrosa]|uniref:VOC family protein n=1 Tax=Pseudoalteromonas umbrosa TaxID=3048489 RepID=UPI0024C465C2|nr:VOC family protein [Pseudoalteromonas sp. B95]MDK1289377.1 VOC family protein [Pseudoalteromonas sp. B95]